MGNFNINCGTGTRFTRESYGKKLIVPMGLYHPMDIYTGVTESSMTITDLLKAIKNIGFKVLETRKITTEF